MITITRKTFTTHSTIGILQIDGQFQCYTLEDVARPIGIKIPHETCIPEGEYEISITMSERFKRLLPLIFNQSDLSVSDGKVKWTGIRMHPGNSNADTDGCILLGSAQSTDWVSGSQDAFDKVFPLIEAMIKSGDTRLVVKNEQAVG